MPRFIHVVRALALLGAAASPGCSSTITPTGDAAAEADVPGSDTTTVTDAEPVDAGAGCPAARPLIGSACQELLRCDYAGGRCVIDDNVYCQCAGPNSTWTCGPNCAIGPLNPPELPV